MKIVVLSDTHYGAGSVRLPGALHEELETAGLVIHAGDIVSFAALELLESYTTVKAVAGNCDVGADERILPHKRLFTVQGVKIGATHSLGYHDGSFRAEAGKLFGDKADLVVFGHTHIPLVDESARPVMFNPGSLKHNKNGRGPSFGVIEIADGAVAKCDIIYL